MPDHQQDLTQETEFAAMLCSRVCHDMANSILALTAGLDFLGEGAPEGMADDGISLMQTSVEKITARLNYARLAYGAMGSSGAEVNLIDVQKFLDDIAKFEKADIKWDIPSIMIAKNKAKIILNLANLAIGSVIRSGEVEIKIEDNPFMVSMKATGFKIRIQDEVLVALKGQTDISQSNVYTIQAIYVEKLLTLLGAKLDVNLTDNALNFTVTS